MELLRGEFVKNSSNLQGIKMKALAIEIAFTFEYEKAKQNIKCIYGIWYSLIYIFLSKLMLDLRSITKLYLQGNAALFVERMGFSFKAGIIIIIIIMFLPCGK